MGPNLTIDLNLVWGDRPTSIKYVGNRNQLSLISVAVIFQLFFTLYCFFNSCRRVFLFYMFVPVLPICFSGSLQQTVEWDTFLKCVQL